MNLRLFLSILFIYTGTYSYTQQLKLDKGPEDYQLFARDKNDSATVLFSGRVTDDAKFNELRLKVYKDGILYDNKSVKIENRGFKFSSIIQAGLFQYRFELYHQIESVEKLSFIADNVVCGDAYIITGQSNSHASSNKSSYTSPLEAAPVHLSNIYSSWLERRIHNPEVGSSNLPLATLRGLYQASVGLIPF